MLVVEAPIVLIGSPPNPDRSSDRGFLLVPAGTNPTRSDDAIDAPRGRGADDAGCLFSAKVQKTTDFGDRLHPVLGSRRL